MEYIVFVIFITWVGTDIWCKVYVSPIRSIFTEENIDVDTFFVLYFLSSYFMSAVGLS